MEDQAYSPPSTTKSYSCFQPPEVSLSLNLLRLWSQLLFYPNCAKKVLTGASVWDRKCDVWCLGALLLEWNLENYMWDIIGHWFMIISLQVGLSMYRPCEVKLCVKCLQWEETRANQVTKPNTKKSKQMPSMKRNSGSNQIQLQCFQSTEINQMTTGS